MPGLMGSGEPGSITCRVRKPAPAVSNKAIRGAKAQSDRDKSTTPAVVNRDGDHPADHERLCDGGRKVSPPAAVGDDQVRQEHRREGGKIPPASGPATSLINTAKATTDPLCVARPAIWAAVHRAAFLPEKQFSSPSLRPGSSQPPAAARQGVKSTRPGYQHHQQARQAEPGQQRARQGKRQAAPGQEYKDSHNKCHSRRSPGGP